MSNMNMINIHMKTASSNGNSKTMMMNEVCAAVENILEEAFMFCSYENKIPAITHRINAIVDSKIEEYFFRERRLEEMLNEFFNQEYDDIAHTVNRVVKTWLKNSLPGQVDELMKDYVQLMTEELQKDIHLSRLTYLGAIHSIRTHRCRMHKLEHVEEQMIALEKRVEQLELGLAGEKSINS